MAKTLIILFFATLLLGVPVAFTMGIAGLAAVFIDGSLNPLIATQRMFHIQMHAAGIRLFQQ